MDKNRLLLTVTTTVAVAAVVITVILVPGRTSKGNASNSPSLVNAATTADSVISLGDSIGPAKLRSCDHETPPDANINGCGILDELYEGTHVIMRCWRDTTPPQGYSHPRWFYLTEGAGAPHPSWSGWVYADLVANQSRTPACSPDILAAYPLPTVSPLVFTPDQACDPNTAQLSATSAGFTPGGTFSATTGILPSGFMYDEHQPQIGTVASDGSVPWTLACQRDRTTPVDIQITVEDESTDRRVSVNITLPPVAISAPSTPPTVTQPPTQQPPPTTSTPPRSNQRPPSATLSVFDQVTNGSTEMREDTPAYLSTVTENYCRTRGCMLPGTDVHTGATLTAVCQTQGDRTTNGDDADPSDDANPQLDTSQLWYGVRWGDGRFGFISEVWIAPQDRGGESLPHC